MSLRHAILGVLEFQPMHGYALQCVLEEGISYFWPVNLPAIYPCLKRLEQEGLVTHETEASLEGRPNRKVCTVTAAGREELARWRREPPESDVPRFRNELFLKLLFSRRENLPDTREWIEREEAQCAKRLAALRGRIEQGEAQPLFVRFLRESGQAHLELHVERLRHLRSQIDEILSPDPDPDPRRDEQPMGLGLEV
ncbi:MAG: PadR family transcriptional regulator, partial [Proteobacteria bacterium]|nr:PadR family transcriptional regulator [Pseudomonadota bacterium]